jgi:outer membrane protein TolC
MSTTNASKAVDLLAGLLIVGVSLLWAPSKGARGEDPPAGPIAGASEGPATAEGPATGQGASQAQAPDQAPAKARTAVNLSLEDAIRMGVENNLRVRLFQLDEQIRRRQIVISQAVFDPFFNLGATYAKNRDPTVSILESDPTTQGVSVSPSEGIDYYGSLRGKYLLGTEYEVRLSQSQLDRPTINPAFTRLNPITRTQISAALRQPLLKGGWYTVNTAGVQIAENNSLIAEEQLELTLIDTVYEVEGAYWDLLFATQNLAAKQKAVDVSAENVRNAKRRLEIGTFAEIDVTTVESQLSLRRAELEEAQLLVEDTRDRLLNLINYTKEESLKALWEAGSPLTPFDNLEVVCTSTPEPGGAELGRDEAMAAAFTHRPDYRQVEIAVRNRELEIAVAKNEMLPALDVFGEYRQLGLEETFLDSYQELGTGDYYSWLAGVEFSIPLSNRAARNAYRNARDELRKTAVEKHDLENSIVIEVDRTLRRIDSLRRKISDLEERVRLQKALLDAERIKLDVGKSIAYTVSVIENDLVDNVAQALRAKADLQRAKAEFYRATGTLLERHGIKFGTE